MFDKLDEIRNAWSANNFIIIHSSIKDDDIFSLCLPSLGVRIDHLKEIRMRGSGKFSVTYDYDFGRIIDLPFLHILYRSVSSRYPVVDRLLKNSDPITSSESATSLSIDLQSTKFGFTDYDHKLTIEKFAQLLEDYSNSEIKQDELKIKFNDNFKIPGFTNLVRSSLGGLKMKCTEIELSLGLCEVLKIPRSTIVSTLINQSSGKLMNTKDVTKYSKLNGYPLVESKTIINLWRSITKVPKSEITYLN